MIELTVNGLPCVAVTAELAACISELGENPADFNWLSWPAGASNYAESVLLMHSDDAAKLAKGDRSVSVALVFSDDTQSRPQDGQIKPTSMYQIEHRPIHTMSGASNTSLVAVRLVDARYFWAGIMVNDGYNMTTTADRSVYYDQSEAAGPTAYTFDTLIALLLSTIGISGTTSAASASGTPNDQLINGERACDALDRLLASAGMVFYAYPSAVSGKSYCIDNPSRFNTNVALANDRFLPDRIAGDVVYTSGDANGKAWLNAIMPSSVTVLFPREIPSSAADTGSSTNPPVLRQFYKVVSTANKPSGVTGRSNFTAIVHDTLWARGPIGSETNAAALATRADVIAGVYYGKFKANHTACRLKGWAAVAPIPGEVVWRLTPSGPYTDIHTNSNWGIYGGDVDVVDGFNRKRVSGLGGIQTFRSYDGSLYLSGTASGSATGLITGAGSLPDAYYFFKIRGNGATLATPGVLSSTANGIFINETELDGNTNSGHDILASPNVDTYDLTCHGRLSGSATISGVVYPIYSGTYEFAGCEDDGSDVDGGGP